MSYASINFVEKFSKFNEQWSPKIIGQMNDYHFKVVKIQGEFVWHLHADTDEVFIVLDGEMNIQFREGEVVLRTGEMFVIPKGLEHKPFAKNECRIMLVERAGTINTGAVESDLTAQDNQWV
jgi:mannose-6-phosphate isomerase-like protein (cupin superfamily)